MKLLLSSSADNYPSLKKKVLQCCLEQNWTVLHKHTTYSIWEKTNTPFNQPPGVSYETSALLGVTVRSWDVVSFESLPGFSTQTHVHKGGPVRSKSRCSLADHSRAPVSCPASSSSAEMKCPCFFIFRATDGLHIPDHCLLLLLLLLKEHVK